MSGDGRIYFGSLEHQERNRINEENKSDATSVISGTTKVNMIVNSISHQATTTQERKRVNTGGRVEIIEFSKVSQHVRILILLRKPKMQKKNMMN